MKAIRAKGQKPPDNLCIARPNARRTRGKNGEKNHLPHNAICLMISGLLLIRRAQCCVVGEAPRSSGGGGGVGWVVTAWPVGVRWGGRSPPHPPRTRSPVIVKSKQEPPKEINAMGKTGCVLPSGPASNKRGAKSGERHLS